MALSRKNRGRYRQIDGSAFRRRYSKNANNRRVELVVMQRKHALFMTGLVFLSAWALFVTMAISAPDETPLIWFYAVIGTPIAQALFFTVYRSNRSQALIGCAVLAVVITVAIGFHISVGSFILLFIVVAITSAVLHMFYGFVVGDQPKAVNA